MDQDEAFTDQDRVVAFHAILDLVDANVAPEQDAGDWVMEVAFLEGEHQRDRAEGYAINTILDGISEQG